MTVITAKIGKAYGETSKVFGRMMASILSVNDATLDERQRENIRRATLDAAELAERRMKDVIAEVANDQS